MDGPFQFAHKTRLPFFAWLPENPPYQECFNNYMSGYRAGKPSWCQPGFYPIEKQLVQGFEDQSGSVMLVDVGGGIGHDLEELKTNYPNLPGKLVLQDTKEVISQVPETSTGFERQVHDFFTPQPVKGARAYYLHSVLHDWDDKSCVKILTQLKPALKTGYSKVLINELVVPDEKAEWSITSMDWLMLVLGAVRERTEAHWRKLLSEAGLKVTKIYTYEQGSESIIEAEPA